MKTLYLHIGQPKTGSSAIQAFLTLNRDKLRCQGGICYPIFDGDYAVKEKTKVMVGNAFNMRMLGCEKAEIGEAQREYVARIRELFQENERVLLSTEGLWHSNGNLYRNILDLLGEDICIKVIVYLRRQDERVESLWNQLVKTHAYGMTCMEYAQGEEGQAQIAGYYERLKQISDVIGKENLIAKIYDPNMFAGGESIYKDFMSALGIEDISGYEQPKYQVNPSLSKNMVEIKRILNSCPTSIILDDEFRKNFRGNIAFAKNTDAIASAPSLLTYEEREMILGKYEEENLKIGQEYFGIEGSPFPALRPQKDSSMSEDIYQDIIFFLGQFLIEQKKEIEQLHALIDTYDVPETVSPQAKVIVYGGDKRCRSLYRYLKRTGRCETVGIVDRRWKLLSELEPEMEDPSCISEKEFDYVLIGLEDAKVVATVREYLRSLGIEDEQIVAV